VAADRPQRAAALELVGRFKDSGFKDPAYLARRSDGQVIQLSRLLYLIAEAADGRRDPQAIAACVAPRIGRRVSGDNVRFLVERKLRPLGVLAAPDGSTPELPKRPPVLALRHRRPLLPERGVRGLGLAFAPLFMPAVIAIDLAALAAFDTWLFGFHGIAPALRSVLYEPTLLLGLVGCVIAATAFHEVGHAAGCRYGGARPGAIGAGVYLVWPAFYCDVTGAYRLDRRGRLRTDLGGVYFNGIVALLAGGAYFATGREGLLLLSAVQHTTMLQQLLPLLRFDGYYVLSDLTGVPDILSRIGPILRSILPFQRTEPKVRDLKPWVRMVVTVYVAVLVPTLLLLLTWMVMGAPRVLATAFDSLGLHAALLAQAFR
jgi:putative peptide zinc metalloprotease protein